MRVEGDEPPLSDGPSPVVLTLVDVPGGIYHLEITSGSLSGPLAVRVGRSAPLQRLTVAPGQTQSFPVVLPAGAGVLVVEAESADLAGQLHAALVPASPASTRSGYARQYSRYSDVDAFFLDGNVFAEADGFWVRGGRTTDVVLSQGSGGANRAGTLTVRNGATANTVTIRSGAWQEALALSPGEARVVALPQADALGSWPLSITSSSGFRPSDTAGEDRRFLGAWISR
jgi:hypothetical protein